jgi:hypothetical protein
LVGGKRTQKKKGNFEKKENKGGKEREKILPPLFNF